ncbi:MAG: DEAD/DEAH box helicase [Spirochaetaceae bacterium]
MKFDDYAFSAEIKSGIQKAKFVDCTPVQEKTFDFILEGRDVYAQSQTGTGKTAAFLISIFHLLQTDKYLNRKALVVVPTRELAVQIKEEADLLGQDVDLTSACFYGGTGYKTQEALLEKGVDIIIATPGRLLDFSKQGKINFKDFSILVVDEADRLFDMGFVDDIRRIFNSTKSVKDKMTLLFSATMNPSVGNISWEYMNNPGEIFIEAEQLTVESIAQELYHVGKDEKMSILLGLLEREKPESAIIFTNTKHMAHEISKRLDHNGIKNEYLMGDLPQKKRLQIVNSVKDGQVKFLVATDVAARGLHVDDLSLVINYDLPLDTENYVHRIGRTARAGKDGKAISLACENYVYSLSGIEDFIDSKIPVFPTTEDLFVEDKSSHLRFSLNEHKNRGRDSRGNNNRGNNNHGNNKRVNSNRNSEKHGNTNRNNYNKVSGNHGNKKRHTESDKERLERVRNSVMNISGTNSLDANFDKEIKHSHKKSTNQTRPNNKNQARPNNKNNRNNRTTNTNTSNPNNNKKRFDNSNNNNKRFDNNKRNSAMVGVKRVSSESNVEERIAYYKKKYGEDFKPSDSMLSNKKKVVKKQPETKVKNPKKVGLLGSISNIFKKK